MNPRSVPFELGEAPVNVVSVPVGTGPMASSMAPRHPRAFGQSKLQSQWSTFSDGCEGQVYSESCCCCHCYIPLPSLHHDGHGLLVTICLILSIRQANPTPRALFFAVRRYLSPWESQHRLSSRDVEMISKTHRCTSKTVGHEPGTFKAKSESRLSRRPNSSKAKTTQRRKRCRHF